MKTRYIDMYKMYTRGKAIYWRKSGVSEFCIHALFLKVVVVVVVVVVIYLSHTQSYQVQSAVKCRGLFKKFTA